MAFLPRLVALRECGQLFQHCGRGWLRTAAGLGAAGPGLPEVGFRGSPYLALPVQNWTL